MKSVGIILSVLAIANLLALAGFVGWLHASDRLNVERVRSIRQMLSVTLSEEKQAAENAESERQRAQAQAEAEAVLKTPPQTAAERIARAEAEDDAALQSVLRVRRELDDLRRALERQRGEIDERSKAVKTEREAFEAERARIAALQSGAQFKKALETLQAQKPDDARGVLQSLLDQRKDEQVTAYLSAMEERVRAKVIAAFAKGDPTLAASLLERLRAHGVPIVSADAPAP